MAREFSDKERATAQMIIRFFNMQAGTAYRYNNSDSRTEMIVSGIEKAGGVTEFRDAIRSFCRGKDFAKDNKQFEDVFVELLDSIEAPAPAQEETAQAAPEPAPAPAIDMNVLTSTITMAVTTAVTQAVSAREGLTESLKQSVREFIHNEFGPIERKVTTVIDGRKVQMDGILHDKFDTVLKFVANDEPVFLTGPAGSGKNVLCKQVAKALGLNFYFTNAVTQEYKLTGFTDAMGNYQPTQFYKAFTEGGLFMLDEMDASIPEVLVILNAAIANRYFDFPAPVGYVEAHPDFRVIAAGNTVGTGASYEYVGRNQLDAASLNRFAVVKIGYSEAIENGVAGGNMELANFCREFRKAALEAGQSVVVSYRDIGRLAKMTQILSLDEALETCLIKGIEKDDLNIIARALPEGDYRTAVRKIVRRM